MPFSEDPGLNGIKELFMWRGWKYMDRREILESLSEIYTNLVYGDQIEEKYAIELAKIMDGLKEYWFE